MGRIRKAAMKYNYKEVYRQLIDQFIHRLSGSEMLTEEIREPNEHMLTRAKRIEAQRLQTAVINSLSEIKIADAILHQDEAVGNKTVHTCENAYKKKMQMLWSSQQTESVPGI